MKSILTDAGPLISLFNKDDLYHSNVITFLRNFKGHLISSWPVITEVTHMLSYNVKVQIDFLEWLQRGAITVANIDSIHIKRIIDLTKKYSDVPMDLADSSLIVLSELLQLTDIITIDSDYYIYRTKSKKMLTNILQDYL